MSVETNVASPASHLPLEWTRIQRANRSMDRHRSERPKRSRDVTWDDCDEGYCTNINCPTRHQPANISSAAICNAIDTAESRRTLSGTVLFCLTDPDCEWFQGYFFVTKQVYFGLLCLVKTDIDECLQCSEGGYREMSMQMTPMNRGNDVAKPSSTTTNFPRILWTGGDMMNLVSVAVSPSATDVTNNLATVMNSPEVAMRMRANSLFSGATARKYVQKYFNSLLSYIQKAHASDTGNGNDMLVSSSPIADNHLGIEEIMPNVAVVSGTMEVWL
jgi:hypothetical protein